MTNVVVFGGVLCGLYTVSTDDFMLSLVPGGMPFVLLRDCLL